MVSGIIVAAGKGVRMNLTIRKQYLAIAGQPILCHTLRAMVRCRLIEHITLVAPKDDFNFCREQIIQPLKSPKTIALAAGGAERQDSVYNGLLSTADKDGIVVIHDGVRPFVDLKTFSVCIEAAKTAGACIVGIPVSETVKQVTDAGFVDKTLDRKTLFLAQTPQVFRYEIIRKAHEKARKIGLKGTDDALLVERMGHDVKVVPGSCFNIKITTPEDLRIAEAILKSEDFKLGF